MIIDPQKSVEQVFDSTLNQCLSLSAQRLLCTLEQRSHPLRGGFFFQKVGFSGIAVPRNLVGFLIFPKTSVTMFATGKVTTER